MTSIPDATPIVIGVGEASERISDPDFAALSPVELAAAAARAALEDAGAAAPVAKHVEVVAGIRQFEISSPRASPPFGRSNNFPRSVAKRLGASPRLAILEPAGGQGPQHLVNEFANRIAAGEVSMALMFGAEAISTVRHLSSVKETRDWSEEVEGSLEDRGYGLEGLITADLVRHGAFTPVQLYAMFENARRARLGLSRDAYRVAMAELFAPFTEVAAQNPHAMSQTRLSVAEIATVTAENRIVADPFPRRVVSRDQANQGAAVLMCSAGKARELGVSEDRWMYLHAGADIRERTPMERADLGAYPAAGKALRQALAEARVAADALDALDLYSCFPIAVFSVLEELGLPLDARVRPLTVTGGLPYFGGAGNNYSMHAIAAMVRRLRDRPGAFGLVGANGGFLSKYSVGVYSTAPCVWREADSGKIQKEVDDQPAPNLETAELQGRVETYTIAHDRDPKHAVLICRDREGSRFVAMTTNEAVLARMIQDDPLGATASCVRDDQDRRVVIGLD